MKRGSGSARPGSSSFPKSPSTTRGGCLELRGGDAGEEAMLGSEVKSQPWVREPTAGSCVRGALCPQPGGIPPALPALEAELPAPFSVPEMGRTAKNASFWKAPLLTRAASKAGLQSLEQNQGIFQGEKISSGVSSWCTAKQCSGWVCLPAPGCSGFVPQRPDAQGQAGFAFPWHW